MEEVVEQKKKRGFAFNFRASLCIPYGVFMALFVVFPLLLIVYYSFTDSAGNFSLNAWAETLSNGVHWKVIGTTLLISACTTVVCILVAYPIAYILANKKFNKSKVIVYIFLLPMWVNFVIRTIGLKELLNWLSRLLFSVDITSTHPYISIVIGMVYDYLPFAILPLYNQMVKLDKSQIEAAADLGANPFQVFVKSIIPQTIPGIVSACMMTFMPTMSSYVIADKMSENTVNIIGSIIDDQFINYHNNNVGSALSMIMLLLVGASLLVEKLLDKKPQERKGNVW